MRVQSLTLPPSESLVKAAGFLEHFPESLVMCVYSTALESLWQDNTELLLAVPEYA